jgi:flagellar hook-associated protein 3 FlgL
MARVTDLSTQRLLVNQMLNTQARLTEAEIQVTSEKKTQVYSGIVAQSARVVNLEVSQTLSERYIQNNDTAELRLDTAVTSLEAIEESVKEFHRRLQSYKSNLSDPPEQGETQEMQKWALDSLKDIQAYLNLNVDGQYIFSGTKTTTQPVDLNLSTLNNFQSTYDGQKVTYPTTRDAHLQEFSLSDDGAATPSTSWLYFDRDDTTGTSTVTMSAAAAAAGRSFSNLEAGSTITISGTGSNNGTFTVESVTATAITIKDTQVVTPTTTPETLTITKGDNTNKTVSATFAVGAAGANDTLTASIAGEFSDYEAGDTITIAGSGENNRTFTISSVDAAGTVITLDTTRLEDEGSAGSEVAGTISSSTWYQGNDQDVEHRLNADRSIDMEFNAIDPAIEKAIRAMGIIAQGAYGTAGGLDQNTDRIDDAMYLLEDSLSFPTSGTAPFGTEQEGSFEQLAFDIGFIQVRVSNANDAHESYIGFLESNIADIENVDLLESITTMQDQARTLEASYQVFARFQELSLNNYI